MAGKAKRNLAIFDIDGTLMHSAGHDVSLFRDAHSHHVGEEAIESHWGNFAEMTDHAINSEFFDRVHGRAPSNTELSEIKRTFIEFVKETHQQDPSKFAPVLGAIEAVRHLAAHPDWAICFASGGWEVSASFKLSTLGISAEEHPGAYGDAHSTRLSLVTSAIDDAKSVHRQDGFDHIVSIGDGEWDVIAARELNLPFVGVASWVDPECLRTAGALDIIRNFEECMPVDRYLLGARVPV